MRRYGALVAALLALFLTAYLLVEALDVPVLADPAPSLERGGAAGAVIGVALLVADAVLPVASSVVMISLGALYGAPVAIALSVTGRVAMAAVGFAIGRRGGALMERVVAPDERARAERLLVRWGALAVVLSRPVPLVAETVAVLAGASRLGWGRFLVAALVGSLPEVLAYSLAGAVAASFGSAAVIWTLFVAAAAGFWLVGRWLDTRVVAVEGGTR